MQYPSSIPVSVAGLELIRRTVGSFYNSALQLIDESGSIVDRIESVKTLHDCSNIPNHIPDGTIPFPENMQDLKSGISVEFRNVSFSYPGSDQLVLDNVSWKIEQGQLCVGVFIYGWQFEAHDRGFKVIVGSNGSGEQADFIDLVRCTQALPSQERAQRSSSYLECMIRLQARS